MRRALGLAVALLALAGCARGRMVRGGAVNPDALAEVRRTLPAVRGLAFTAEVPALAMDRAGLGVFVAGDLDATYTAEDLAHLEATYARLGFLPPGTELRPLLLRLYQEEGAGFYDPRTKRLILSTHAGRAAPLALRLVGALTGRDPVGEFLVAHELTHALQDQHYGLPVAPEPLTDAHGDRVLARRALLEGDATLAGFAYLLGGRLDAATRARAERELARTSERLAESHPDLPALVRATLAFQYDQGTVFVGRAFAAGGWRAVDALHLDPPESTEQVLHPERYYDAPRDRPLTIALAGTEPLVAAGFAPVLADTLGELPLRVLAGQRLPPERAAAVAAGWDGDRLGAFARDDEVALVWMTAWDTPADAEEFAAALPAILPEAHAEQREDRVLVLLGPAGGSVDLTALAARVWARTTVVPENAPALSGRA